MPQAAADYGPAFQIAQFLRDKEWYSYTSLDRFQRCHRKYKYQNVLRLGSLRPTIKADAGSAMHAGLAALYKTYSVESALDALRKEYQRLFAWVTEEKIARAYQLPSLEDILIAYIDNYKNDPLQVDPTMVEVGTIVQIQDFYYISRMDLVAKRRGSGDVIRPVDHKTTGSMDGNFAGRFYPDSQITSQIYSLRRIVGNQNDRRAIINGILIAAEKRHFERPEIFRTPADLDEWEQEAIGWVASIRSHRDRGYWPKTTGACWDCAFREACNTHEEPAVLASYPKRTEGNIFHF